MSTSFPQATVSLHRVTCIIVIGKDVDDKTIKMTSLWYIISSLVQRFFLLNKFNSTLIYTKYLWK